MLKVVSIAGKLLSPVENGGYPFAPRLSKLVAGVPEIASSNEPVIGVEPAGDITEHQSEHKATNSTDVVFFMVDLISLDACEREERLASKGSTMVFDQQAGQARNIFTKYLMVG